MFLQTRWALCGCVVVTIVSPSSRAQNLLVNGSFETGTFMPDGANAMTLEAGATNMTAWTVYNGSLAWIGSPNAFGINGSDGAFFLDLAGYDDAAPYGGVMQTFATTVGAQYVLTLDLSAAGVPSVVSASAGDFSGTLSHDSTGLGTQWRCYSAVFTATDETTTLMIHGVSGGIFIGLDNVAVTTGVTIASANPPLDDPFTAGTQPFRDVLEHVTVTGQPRGIGAAATPSLAGINYANPRVTFSQPISPPPAPDNIAVTCTDLVGNGTADCPTVLAVAPGTEPNEYVLTLSGSIPSRECTTITFAGTATCQKVQYRFLPGDVGIGGSGSGIVTAQDVTQLIAALNGGAANSGNNPARYNVNRVGPVTSQDVARLIALLNGGFNGATAGACP
jgi:hypothetical protein